VAETAGGAAQGKRIEIWYQHEARIGQKNTITRQWAKRGSRPSSPHDQRSRSAYIFGAICPKLEKPAALVMPCCDPHAMTQHLAEISRHVADDVHAVLIMDQAGWHMSNTLVISGNISILPQPAKSPGPNPVENLWLVMRENWLSNRSSSPMTISSRTAATSGANLKASHGASCPSKEENGRMGSDQ
jgi:hypothetical protein